MSDLLEQLVDVQKENMKAQHEAEENMKNQQQKLDAEREKDRQFFLNLAQLFNSKK